MSVNMSINSCPSYKWEAKKKIIIINIKNRNYYTYDDMINIKDFDSSLLKLDKKSFKNIAIYSIEYIAKKTNMQLSV